MNLQKKISFSNVSFAFDGRVIIKDFTEEVAYGEHVCIMGESGAGKSTLLDSVVGLTFPQKGSVKVDSLSISPQTIQQIRSRVSWVPQNINLPFGSVLETLEAPYMLAVNRHLHFDKERCLDLFGRVGLHSSLLEKDMDNLSGGERQRISLVSAILMGRSIMLLDEPTSALDAISRDRITHLLSELRDTTILAVSHDEPFAESMDRIITLKKI